MDNKLSNLKIIELIEIIESPQNYQEDFIILVNKELDLREITLYDKNLVAISLFRKRLNKYFETNLYSTTDFELPSSVLISEKVKMELFKEEFNSFKSKREMFNSGLESYIAGI